ncbi:MAG: hypothetical protein HUN04_17250 [Desulfobacter sp.]|nr:MAG: hypothetical protein HUN04_17250 [Desulfobacter sp.]
MEIPQGFFIIYQPKYRVPSVFDLHHRGLFKNRPFVTQDFGFRVIADASARARLQCAWIVKERTDNESGTAWDYTVKTVFLDLDKDLSLPPAKLADALEDDTMAQKIGEDLAAWRTGYLPDNNSTRDLEKKILTAIEDHKGQLRKALVHKNHDWIMAGLARRLQNFRFYLYPRVRETLMTTYRDMGGESDEARLIRHIVLFSHIFDHDRTPLFKRLGSGEFAPDDQAWECWIGFTGSEDESRRLCRTMEAVFNPLAQDRAA